MIVISTFLLDSVGAWWNSNGVQSGKFRRWTSESHNDDSETHLLNPSVLTLTFLASLFAGWCYVRASVIQFTSFFAYWLNYELEDYKDNHYHYQFMHDRRKLGIHIPSKLSRTNWITQFGGYINTLPHYIPIHSGRYKVPRTKITVSHAVSRYLWRNAGYGILIAASRHSCLWIREQRFIQPLSQIQIYRVSYDDNKPLWIVIR